jgi:Fis family transcriptional regulator
VAGRALLLHDAPAPLTRACAAAGLDVVRARTARDARALLSRGSYDLVDGRIARPRPLDEEMQVRVDAFFDRLRGHAAGGRLYDAVMRAVERPLIAGALARASGVRGAAAASLGIDRGTLSRRLRALGLEERG